MVAVHNKLLNGVLAIDVIDGLLHILIAINHVIENGLPLRSGVFEKCVGCRRR
jgi:hypothetical protein